MFRDFIGRALSDDFSAEDASTRADIDNVIGGTNGIVIVFDQQNGVSKISQFTENREEPCVVSRMKADAWFVENVENADKRASDL
jgi:hypothetical protein